MSFPIYHKRHAASLNGLWQFGFRESHAWDDEDIASVAYDDRMPVPSAFDAMPAYNGERGVGFYRRTFRCPPGCRGRLLFNAVGMYAKVFVDGEKIGEQYAAYTPFAVTVPPSDRAEREVVVMAGNRFDYDIYPLHEAFFDFYAYGGIFRDVDFHVLPEQGRIDWVGVETVSHDTGDIRVRVRGEGLIETCGISVDGGPLQSLSPDEGSGDERVFLLTVADATPWSPEHPELHTLTVDTGADAVTVRFGIRQITAKDGHILLNGAPVKLLGYCRHEAHPQYGPALPYAQLVADIQLLRDQGCNFVRGSHYQQDPRFLDLCDEMGLLVFEESLGWGQSEKHFTDPTFIRAQIKQTADMIESSYNHPSVILRGFLNEGASDHEDSRDCYRQMVDLCRTMDPHRLITYASNRCLNDLSLELVDVVCFNIYPGWYSSNRDDEKPLGEIPTRIQSELNGLKERGLGNKPFIISEIGAGAIYGWRDPICAHWSEEYQREYLGMVCREVVNCDAIAGVALWQFCDCRTYRGSRALGRPRAFNNKGTLDEYRRPKLAYETVRDIFRGAR